MSTSGIPIARVSNLLRNYQITGSIGRTQSQLLRVQNELSTGRRLTSPSDEPGDAAVAQQLRKTLESRVAYETNLRQATTQLSDVDSTLGEITNLLREATSIASANISDGVSEEERKGAAQVIASIESQMLALANKQFAGVHLFAGDRLTEPPFEMTSQGVKFVGSDRLLANVVDENTTLPFMLSGADVFGGVSQRVAPTLDLTPTMSADTRLADLRGAAGNGVTGGTIRIANGGPAVTVDLSQADTIGDVIDLINASGTGATASIAAGGQSLEITGAAVTIEEVGGGTTATDLGIRQTTPAATVTGQNVGPRITVFTPLTDLPGPIDPSGITITNGGATESLSFAGLTTVGDLLNQINTSNIHVQASINDDGTAIELHNTVQGSALTITENGGTTGADLGWLTFTPDSPLAEFNNGRGVGTTDGGADLRLKDTGAISFDVDLSGAVTAQDVIDAINTAATGAGSALVAAFDSTAPGFTLTNVETVVGLNDSLAKVDLGLDEAPVAGVVSGKNVNAVKVDGVFGHLAQLRIALEEGDVHGMTLASEGLAEDEARSIRERAGVGSRVQEMDNRLDRIEQQNIVTKDLLGRLEDTDVAAAILEFQTLQTSLQATMQTSSVLLNLSLFDFLR